MTGGWLGGTWEFARRVVVDFHRNKGLLLAGAIAYNALLSLLPLIAVLFAVTSHLFERDLLFSILNEQLGFLIPARAHSFTVEVESLLDNRALLGGVGAVVLIFFSSMAFRTLDDAFAVIFHHTPGRRRFWVSAALPFVFMLLLLVGLIAITGLTVALDTMAADGIRVLGRRWAVPDASEAVIYYGGVVGLIIMFAAVYLMMPTAKVKFQRALIGGLIAAVLWEFARRVMVWYFSNLSVMNVIYGSAATIIFILLIFEVAAVILLLGAQAIAELERLDNERTTKEA